MNRYGQLALDHWRVHDPARYAAVADPGEFFSALGEQVETEVQTLTERLAGPDPAAETYLAKVGRLNMARLQAEEQVLAETALVPAPAQEDTEAGEGSDPLSVVMAAQAEMDRARAEDDQNA
jgi:hypothetical protein